MSDHSADNSLDVRSLFGCDVWHGDVYRTAKWYVESVRHTLDVFVQNCCVCVVPVNARDVCLS